MREVEDLHQWYRALDFLITHKGELEADLFEAQKDLFNQETPRGYPMVLTMKDMPVMLRTELEGDAQYGFRAVGLKIPPRLLSNPSDIQEIVVLRG